MKKALVLAAIVALGMATGASAQILNTPHNLAGSGTGNAVKIEGTGLNGQTCVFCHTPHNASTVMTALWNRNNWTAPSYTLYTSDSLQAVLGQPTKAASAACLSCHDGTVAFNVLINVNGAGFTGSAFTKLADGKATYGSPAQMTGGAQSLGTNLSNDHPVAFQYTPAAALDSGLVAASGTTKGLVGTLPLYGSQATGTVECATCHNPHDNQFGNFLRISNTNSALCTTCHLK